MAALADVAIDGPEVGHPASPTAKPLEVLITEVKFETKY
jgi:hypothetical protein